jgi:hypothetical protein
VPESDPDQCWEGLHLCRRVQNPAVEFAATATVRDAPALAAVAVVDMIADGGELDSKATVDEAPALADAAGVAESVSVVSVETGTHLLDCSEAKLLGSAAGPRENLVLVAGYSPEGTEEKQGMLVVAMLVAVLAAAAIDSARLPPTPLAP